MLDKNITPQALVLMIETFVWLRADLNKPTCPWRRLADALALWWEPQATHPVIKARANGKCELCQKPFTSSNPPEYHHIHSKGTSSGFLFLHHPGNASYIHRECHAKITGDGRGVDIEGRRILAEFAASNLPPWALQATAANTKAIATRPAREKRAPAPIKATVSRCAGCRKNIARVGRSKDFHGLTLCGECNRSPRVRLRILDEIEAAQ